MYVGESKILNKKIFPSRSKKLWKKHAGKGSDLYVAFHVMSEADQGERRDLGKRIIDWIDPPCNL